MDAADRPPTRRSPATCSPSSATRPTRRPARRRGPPAAPRARGCRGPLRRAVNVAGHATGHPRRRPSRATPAPFLRRRRPLRAPTCCGAMLGAHPELTMSHETGFVPKLAETIRSEPMTAERVVKVMAAARPLERLRARRGRDAAPARGARRPQGRGGAARLLRTLRRARRDRPLGRRDALLPEADAAHPAGAERGPLHPRRPRRPRHRRGQARRARPRQGADDRSALGQEGPLGPPAGAPDRPPPRGPLRGPDRRPRGDAPARLRVHRADVRRGDDRPARAGRLEAELGPVGGWREAPRARGRRGLRRGRRRSCSTSSATTERPTGPPFSPERERGARPEPDAS